MNEFEFKAYKSKTGVKILGACWVQEEGVEVKNFIIFYEHKGIIYPMDNISEPGEYDTYKKKEKHVEEGMESWNKYVSDALSEKIESKDDIPVVESEIYFILEDTLNSLKRIGFIKKEPQKMIESLKKKKIGKITSFEEPMEQYKSMLGECGVENTRLEEYIEEMPFVITN